jgi:transmembrane sensor
LAARVGRFGEMPPAKSARGRAFAFPRAAWLGGLAAAVVLGLGTWGAISLRTPAGEHYATTPAKPRRVALSDGSVVDINASSDVRVQLSTRERRVTLGAGEAHFEVAHDASRPFVVTAGGVTVRAVGTAFTVRLANDAVDVLVVDGKVEVTPLAGTPSPTVTVVPPLVAAGERTRILRETSTARPTIEKVAPESIRALLAWQDPMTSFADVPLREVVARFNRRNATQLTIGDPELGERKIGGMIALDQIDAFVRLLEQDGDVVAERRGSAGIVLRRAR